MPKQKQQKICFELPKLANISKVATVDRKWQRLPRVAKRRQRLPKDSKVAKKGLPEMTKVAKSC